MHLHNARENHIYNNIFVDNAGPQGKTHQLPLQTWNDSPSGVFLRDRQPKMLKDYERLMTNPAWAAMRGMHVSPADPFLPDGTIMRGNVITRNIFYYPSQPESRYIRENGVNLQHNTIDLNVVWNGGTVPVKTGRRGFKKTLADPLLTDPEHGDFTLQPESLAPKLGFEPIPFRDIGPYQDDARATWPIQEAEGVRENPQWLRSDPMDKS